MQRFKDSCPVGACAGAWQTTETLAWMPAVVQGLQNSGAQQWTGDYQATVSAEPPRMKLCLTEVLKTL